MRLSFLLGSLLTTFFPDECHICGTALIDLSRTPVCDDCLRSIKPMHGNECDICSERLAGAIFDSPDYTGPRLCGICSRHRHPFTRAVAYGSYDGELLSLIHLLKFERVQPAAIHLGKYLAAAIRRLESDLAEAHGEVIVISVPLHRKKRDARGFNQTDLVLRAALRQLRGWNIKLARRDAIQRVRATESQTGLTRHQRRKNMRAAFVVKHPDCVKGKHVLLIDDVFTTGATISECARTLKRAGAAKVFAATIARVYKFSAAELDRWHFAELGTSTFGVSPTTQLQHQTKGEAHGDRTTSDADARGIQG